MSSQRIAVSLSADLLHEEDRLAKRLGKSRSGLISELLTRATREARSRCMSGSRATLSQESLISSVSRSRCLGRSIEASGSVTTNGDPPGRDLLGRFR
jgi:metal-responsive CopG/Arc/MetJ family transcriptional regulator